MVFGCRAEVQCIDSEHLQLQAMNTGQAELPEDMSGLYPATVQEVMCRLFTLAILPLPAGLMVTLNRGPSSSPGITSLWKLPTLSSCQVALKPTGHRLVLVLKAGRGSMLPSLQGRRTSFSQRLYMHGLGHGSSNPSTYRSLGPCA